MNPLLRFLQNRNSAPKLCDPAPDGDELKEIFAAAVRAPDHAWLRPWRFLTIRDERRAALGVVLEANLLRRNPEADTAALEKARKSPMRGPLLIVVITRLSDHAKVPHVEQRLSAGCAAQAILLAAEAMGYAGIWRTGDAAFDRNVMADLGLDVDEEIVGFLYVGTRDGPAKKIPTLAPEQFVSSW